MKHMARAGSRHVFLAVAAFVFAATGLITHAQRTSDPIIRVLDVYSQGQYDSALGQLRAIGSSRAIRSRLSEHAPRWVDAAPLEFRGQRWRIAAVVALEAAHFGFMAAGQPGIPYSRRNDEQLFNSRELLEVGCSWLQQGQASEFERVWLLASVALVHSVQNHYQTYTTVRFWRNSTIHPDIPIRPMLRAVQNDLAAVANPPRRGGPFLSTPDEWTQQSNIQEWDLAHWGHATSRFPSESRFKLARILARPEARRLPNRPGVSAFFMTQGFGVDADESYRIGDRWHDSIELVQQAFLDLGALVEEPQVGAEARLRRGILDFHRANLAESLDELRHATKTSDRDVAYVGHIYTGLALDGLNRRKEAIDAFEAALQLVPGAPSAVMALAADLFLADRRAEASARLEAAFAEPAAADPWKRFSLRDYRFWPTYLKQLREAVSR